MTQHEINPVLIDVADWKVRGNAEKQAFVPPGADPAAGGAPPMDPAMAAAGGAPPMDPAMAAAGGAPPPDPAMAAAGAPPMDPIVQQAITQAVQAAMGPGGAGAGAAGGVGPGKGAGKVDPGLLYMELGRIRKMLTTMFQNLGWDLPPDILDDEMVAQSVAGGQPGGPPTDMAGAAPAAPAAPAPADPAAAGEAPPLPPGIDPAALQGIPGSGGVKMGKDATLGDIMFAKSSSVAAPPSLTDFNTRIDALAIMARQLNAK